MKKWLIQLGTKFNISNWVTLLFLAVILPLNLFIILITNQSISSLKKGIMNGIEHMMEIHIRELDSDMAVMENYVFSMDISNPDFIAASNDASTSKGRLAFYNLYRELQDHISINQISGIYFLKKKGNRVLAASAFGTGMIDYWKECVDYVENSQEHPDFAYWHIAKVGTREYFILEQTQGLLYYGAMIPTDIFLSNVEKDISLSHQKLEISDSPLPSELEETVVSLPFSRPEVYLNFETDTQSVTGNFPFYQRLEYFIAFGSLLVIPLLYYMLNRILIEPMRDLESYLSRVEDFSKFRDFSEVRIKRQYYTKALNHVKMGFNNFMNQIQHLKIEAYEKELEKQRIREDNIILQVHPHFLLNLYHLIYSMAEIKNYEGIQKVSLYMSRYFRELFLDSETHLLLAELELVRNYLNVLEIQYPDRFSVSMDVEQETEDIQVPILMIHGFLENTAKYAIRMNSFTEIGISARMYDGYVEIIVSDDGPGISEDILLQINAGEAIERKDGRHIGLSNLRERLKLRYGDKAYMKAYSEDNMGTTIVVRIPWEEKHNESSAS